MAHTPSTLTVLYYGPAIDVALFRSSLERQGVKLRPLVSDVRATSAHGPALHLLSAGWWREQPLTRRRQLLRQIEQIRSTIILVGRVGDSIPSDLEAADLVRGWLEPPVSSLSMRCAIQGALDSMGLRLELSEVQEQLEERRREMQEVQQLFAGFVRAAVAAVEARDPSTYGHSERVAALTIGMARALNEVQTGRWRDVHFSPQDLKELEYAGLLHDFGKLGVRDHVLVKPKKLYDWKLEEIRHRFRLARRLIEQRYTQRKLELILTEGHEAYAAREPLLDRACARELRELEQTLQLVLEANEPGVLTPERLELLLRAGSSLVLTPEGRHMPLLTEDELEALSSPRGTLDAAERREIESHVTNTFDFLMQIPWTKDLQKVPTIAYAHHEKLDGTGYPRGLAADQIPLQARMMTIADVFDALTASDRPYKLAVSLERALDILTSEARDGQLDAELVDLFIQREVYRLVPTEYWSRLEYERPRKASAG